MSYEKFEAESSCLGGRYFSGSLDEGHLTKTGRKLLVCKSVSSKR